MKTILTLSATAAIAVLAGCDGGVAAKKPVEQNKNAPAPGSITSGAQSVKDKLKSADSAQAGDAGKTGEKPKAK